VRRLEALAIAIAREHEAFEPSSEAFETLNPGLLRWANRIDRINPPPKNKRGTRIFTNFQSGWQALLNNLQAICLGKTKAVGYNGFVTPDSSIIDLSRPFAPVNIRRVVEFLQEALQDRAITELTKLNFFTEEPHVYSDRNSDTANAASA